MKKYILKTNTDQHGQPTRIFKARLENNVAKAIDQLTGICSGILADGNVNENEAQFFSEWVRNHAPLEPVWPFTEVLSRLERIFSDGRCDEDERQELKGVMEALCGYTQQAKPEETYSTTFPLTAPLPALVFPGRRFNITGKFAFGTRKNVMEAIESRGGFPVDSAPTLESHYLVIGVFASRDWINTNHGRKIEKAVELRDSGSGLAIVSEEHWTQFLD